MSPRTVLVTGAGGFIGGAVAARLVADGRPVAAGLRRPSRPQASPDPLWREVVCDLDRPESLRAALAGTGAVVHAAVGPPQAMAVQLAALLDAAGEAGIDRFVHFSSIAIYGERDGLVREEDGPIGEAGAYGEAKRACETILSDWVAAAAGRRAIVLRPGIVYGPGSRLWTDGLLERIACGAVGDFGARGDGIAALVHVEDVAEAAIRSLDLMDAKDSGPWPKTFNLVGPDRPRWNAYFRALAASGGLGPLRPVGSLALGCRQAASLPLKLLARRGLPVPRGLALTPLRGEMRLFARAAEYGMSHTGTVLGWCPRIGLAEGLARSSSS